MAIKLTSREFFTEKIDTDIPALSDIGRNFLENGEAAAEKQLADYLRGGGLNTAGFFSKTAVREPSEEELAEGERILDGWLISCGVPIHFEGRKNIDWYANPTYNNYCEWPYQLSRHGEWHKLARLYRATGDERYAEAFCDYLMSWLQQTEEPPHGSRGNFTLAWRTLECGIRLELAWLDAIMTFISAKAVDDHVISCFFRSVFEHADRLLDAATSHNWLISEMSGLNAAALAFTFFKDSAYWYDYSMGRLEGEFDVQIYKDGFQYELTTGYHKVVINTYRRVIRLHALLGRELPDGFLEKVANLYRVYIKLMLPNRQSPALNDGGAIDVPSVCREAIEFMPSLRGEFEYLGEGVGCEPNFKSILMDYSGIAVMRSGWGEGDFCAIFESAPFGYSHQHEDKLEIILHAYGKRLLSDFGNFRYDGSDMRKYVLSSYSHNVALVDGMGQARRGLRKWESEFINLRADIKASFGESVEAACGFYDDGFGDVRLKVRHERTFIWHKCGLGDVKVPFYTVYDRFIPEDNSEHTYTLLWHLEDVEVEISENRIVADYGDGVKFTILSMTQPKISRGELTPYMSGWKPNHTPGDNPHYPIPTVKLHYSGSTLAVATLLFPSKDEACPIDHVNCDGMGNITVTADGKSYSFNKNEFFREK